MHLLQARTIEAAEAVTKKKGKESDTADRIPDFERVSLQPRSAESGVNNTASQQLPYHSVAQVVV